MEFIELNRSFGPPDKKEDDYSYLLLSRRYTGTKSWAELLQERRVVVLASAGSGKTEEFREKARLLNQADALGLFFAIEELADQSIEDCLSATEERALSEWRSNSNPGYFFLDSVDEAKLRSKHCFRRALKKLAKTLGDHLERAHIFVSCRPSDWDHETDLKDFVETFSTSKPAETAETDNPKELDAAEQEQALLEPVLKAKDYNGAGDNIVAQDTPPLAANQSKALVVVLDPLNSEQQSTLAKYTLGTDPTEFMEEVKLQGLEPFAKRPSDLIQLAAYFKKNGAFGTLAEMTENNIHELLKERPGRPDGDKLSEVEAYSGAKKLALALTLAKRLTLLAPGQTKDDDQETVDPALVLNNWSSAQIETLLRRGLFAPASFGCVRFQHRTTIEYLAAQQLGDLMQSEVQEPLILEILFPEEFGIRTIPPELRPIAAWLASGNERVRQALAQYEPMELVRYGDPKSLAMSVRKALLHTLAERHQSGDVSRTEIDDRAVWAFSSPELADDIRACWIKNTHWEFRILLLEIIEQGKIAACAELAKQAIYDESEGSALIHRGIDALLALEDTGRLSKIAADLVQGKLKLSQDSVASVCYQLYPNFISTIELLELVAKAPTPKRFSTEGFSWRIVDLFRRCPDPEIDNFLTGLCQLALQTPHKQRWERVSVQYGYLADHADEIAQNALDRLAQPELSSGLVQLLVAGERSNHHGALKEYEVPVTERVEQNPELKHALFWADLGEVKSQESKHDLDEHPHLRIYAGHRGRYWGIGPDDISWLRDAARDRSQDQYDSDTAYYLWLEMAILYDQFADHKSDLIVEAEDSDLRKKWLRASLQPRSKPDWEKRQEEREARFRRKEQKRQGAAIADWKGYAKELKSKLPSPNYDQGITGEHWRFLNNLTNWLCWRSNYPKSRAPRTWQALRPAFGYKVAEAYMAHFKALWRATPHKRRRWKGNHSTTYYSSVYAFAGIGMEADADPNWATKLDQDEALQAVKHMARADEGAPDWLPALLQAHPKIVSQELRSELKREWCSASEWPHAWIDFFAYGDAPLPEELAPIAVSVLMNNEPGRPERWDQALKILRRISLTNKDWNRFEAKARQLVGEPTSTAKEVARHLAILCFQDINSAITTIEDVAARSNQVDLETIIGTLFDGRRGHSIAVDTLRAASASTLERLVRVIYKRIKPKDDQRHEGAYSPSARDFAESARSTVFDALFAHRSQAAYEAMRRLAKDKSIASSEHWFKVLSKRMVEGAASIEAWSESEVRDFINGAKPPANTPKKFFQLSMAILEKVVRDFDTADASSKKVLRRAKNEDEVRDWLLEQLTLRSGGRYSAFREAQVHAEKRPDIVMSSHSTDAQVAVEIKHSDKGWSLTDLRKALADQLVGLYLKPENRRSGVLVVSHHEKKYWVHPDTKRLMSFDEVLSDLRILAGDLETNHFPLIRVRVIGISCR